MGSTEPETAPVEAAALDARVVKAVTVADAIAAGTPAEEAFAANGIDADAFRALLYEIAEDPALSDAYAAARK